MGARYIHSSGNTFATVIDIEIVNLAPREKVFKYFDCKIDF